MLLCACCWIMDHVWCPKGAVGHGSLQSRGGHQGSGLPSGVHKMIDLDVEENIITSVVYVYNL